jgi:hypothetical protein
MCRELHGDFIGHSGSCLCYDIQEKLTGRTYNLLDPEVFKEAVEAGMIERYCSEV